MTFQLIQTPQASTSGKNAFSYLMTKEKQVDRPKPKVENDANDKIYNASVGDKLVKLLTDTLWHITSHNRYFSERGAKPPHFFVNFSNRNEYLHV